MIRPGPWHATANVCLLAISITLFSVISPAYAVEDRVYTGEDWHNKVIEKYGFDGIKFNVIRKGKIVGTHSVNFQISDSNLDVRATTNIAVKFLGVTLYRYDYVSIETWNQGAFVGVETTVNENGNRTVVSARAVDGGLRVSNRAEILEMPSPLYTTNHWNAGVLESDAVFNTATGNRNDIAVAALGPEEILVGKVSSATSRYRFEGQLNIDVWYDEAGRWTGLLFKDARGADLVLECIVCGVSDKDFAREAGL